MKADEENIQGNNLQTLPRFSPRQLINYCIQHPEKKITSQDIAALHTGKEVPLFSKIKQVNFIDDMR